MVRNEEKAWKVNKNRMNTKNKELKKDKKK